MFREIFAFELKTSFKKPTTYVYFLLFFTLSFMLMILAGGTFSGAALSLGTSNKVFANAPFTLTQITIFIGYFGVFITAPIMGQATYRDIHYGTYHLFYTKPITKTGFLGGRYLAALCTLIFIFSSVALGFWLGSVMPFVQEGNFGPNRLDAYVMPYLTGIIPNLIFLGFIFFAIGALTRKIFPVYVTGVVLFIGYLISSGMTEKMDNRVLASLLDPFGMEAVSRLTRYWTVAEQNGQLVLLQDVFLYNRLFWGVIGFVAAFVTWQRFSFTHLGGGARGKTLEEETQPAVRKLKRREAVSLNFSIGQQWSHFVNLSLIEFKQTVRSVPFIVISLCGALFILVIGFQIGEIFGTPTYPVTYRVLEILGGNFSLFLVIVIIFYSGQLVWRERDAGIGQIFDALPIPNYVIFLSKLASLIMIVALMNTILLVCCLLVQTASGYTHYELGLYVKTLYGVRLLYFSLICVMAMFLQVLVNNKNLAHFFVIVYYIINTMALGGMGFEHRLYRYAQPGSMTYSDMNGFGHYLEPFLWYNLYWVLFAVMLVVVANLFQVRGMTSRFGERLSLARQRFSMPTRVALGIAATGFLAVGSFIYYNTNVLNQYMDSDDLNELTVNYEKKYKHYEQVPQPHVTSAYVEIDIHPDEREVFAKGRYQLVNENSVPVDQLIILLAPNITLGKVATGIPMTPELEDREINFHVFKLSEELAPGASTELNFEVSLLTPGFVNNGSSTKIVQNGTFLNNRELLPTIGYSSDFELGDDKIRKKKGLEPKPRVPSLEDKEQLQRTYISNDGDWIDFEAVVSTVPEQIAIAPGYLQKEWTENGRRYFHYKMDSKILNFYNFVSAEYEVKKDTWNDVAIEIYYHHEHAYNVDRMIRGVQRSLDYFTANFSPYQHRQVRIIEFPRYATFAQSFPNTIPYSEAIGFIANVDDNDVESQDYPFYVTAHEVAHQWWAHQVIGANVQGSTVMSESLSEYSALMVLEKEYGVEKMRHFLKGNLDRYLSGRSRESKRENPLLYNENQTYIHYSKGSLILYALRDYIGEETLNGALARYIRDVGFQEPPFTTSPEFFTYLKEVTPEDKHDLLEDMFEHITLFDLRAVKAQAKSAGDNRFEVTLDTRLRKLRADELGAENEVEVNDLVDVGVLDKDGKILYLEKHRISGVEQSFTITVEGQPHKAGIDPFNKLIDRQPDDNIAKVEIL